MALPTTQMIKETLEREFPELHPGAATGVLAGLILSVFFSGLMGLGLFALVVFETELDVSPIAYLAAPVVTVVLAYFVGYLLRDNTSFVGTELANQGAAVMHERHHSAFGSRRSRTGEEMVAAGCLMFVVQFLFTNVYVTLEHLRKGEVLTKQDDRSVIGAGIIHCLLSNGAVPQDELENSLSEQGISPPETREVLAFLSSQKLLERTARGLSVTPFKKDLFL